MFCPQCGTNQSDELKFCKSCGANLYAVRQVVTKREAGEKFNWNNTWLAEVLLSPAEREKRKQELELQRGITPEVKRLWEVKAGVITASAGIGVGIFLFIFMQGVILSGKVSPGAAEILSRLWVTGVIPLVVGLALLINGMFVRPAAKASHKTDSLEKEAANDSLQAGEPPSAIPSGFSVTEETTRHLRDVGLKQ
jgi:hypothetical protein